MLSVTDALKVKESPVVAVPDVVSIMDGASLSLTVRTFSSVEFQLFDESDAWKM